MIETLPCRSCGAAIIAYPDDPYVATLTGDPTFPYFTLCPEGQDCFFDGNGNSTRNGSLLYDCCGHTLTGWYQVGDNLAAVTEALIVQCQNSYASECVPSTPVFTPILPSSAPLYFNTPYNGPGGVTIPAARYVGTTQIGPNKSANNSGNNPGVVSLSDLSSDYECLNTALAITITASGSDVTVSNNTWSVDVALLPAGITFSNTGGTILTISGSPVTEGMYPFTVTFTAHSGSSVTKNFSFAVWDCTPVTLSDLSPSESYVGDTNTWSIVASGPIIASSGNTWTLSELPPGLTSSNTGGDTLTITGPPTTAGTFYFTVSFLMPSGNHIEKYYTLVVDPVITLSDLSPTEWYVGEGNSWDIVASGPTIPSSGNTWTIDNSELPTGLTSDNTGGDTLTIHGTPTTEGTFDFDVMFTMADGETVAKAYILVIDLAVVLSDLATSEVDVGESLSLWIYASGPVITPLVNTWTVGTLPPGLTSSNAGSDSLLIQGTPTTPGTYNFDITFDMPSGNSVTQSYSLVVDTAITLTDMSPVEGYVGETHTWTITASGPTIPSSGNTWSVGSLPPDLTSSSSGGANLTITGDLTTAGTFPFNITFTMVTGETVTKGYSLLVDPALVLSSLSPVEVYSYEPQTWSIVASGPTIASSGNTWTVGTLPTGLSSSNTGGDTLLIQGTVSLLNTYAFGITFLMPSGETATQSCHLTVDGSWWFYANYGKFLDYIWNVSVDGTVPAGYWTMVGSLPPGISWRSLEDNQIEIYGTTTAWPAVYHVQFIGTKTDSITVNVFTDVYVEP